MRVGCFGKADSTIASMVVLYPSSGGSMAVCRVNHDLPKDNNVANGSCLLDTYTYAHNYSARSISRRAWSRAGRGPSAIRCDLYAGASLTTVCVSIPKYAIISHACHVCSLIVNYSDHPLTFMI